MRIKLNIIHSRQVAHYFMGLSFLALMGATAVYQSRFIPLKAPKKITNKNYFPLSPTYLQDVSHIHIKNNRGRFSLQKFTFENQASWRLIGQGRFPAQVEKVISVLAALSTLTVKKTYDLSMANIQNFNLNHPLAVIKLSNGVKKETVYLSSNHHQHSYIKVEGVNKIYQVEFKTSPSMDSQAFLDQPKKL